MEAEKAQVEGFEEQRTKEEDVELSLEEMREEILNMVNVELSQEAGRQLRGVFDDTGMYNMPRYSSKGQKVWKECDLMPGGCDMKGQQPHVHIVGVGIKGALHAMRSYGKMNIRNEMPELKTMEDKVYWVAHSLGIDKHNDLEMDMWYFEPALKKANNKYVENEHAPHIAQSKCMRNLILAIIPGNLTERWVEDYRAGKKPFDPDRAKEFEKPKPKKQDKGKPKEKPEAKTQAPAETEFSSEEIPDNDMLDNMTAMNDWIDDINKCTSLEGLESYWSNIKSAVSKHPGKSSIVRAKDEKKAKLESQASN